MKTILRTSLVVVMAAFMACLMCVYSWADGEIIASGNCGKQGGNLTWTLTDTGVFTITGTGAMSDDGQEYRSWNSYLDSIKSVVIEDGASTVGANAFYNCSNLTSVDIPDSVTSIGFHAFSGCSSLPGIDIPSSVTSIGEGAFGNCSSLKSFSFPDNAGFTSISKGVLSSCVELTTVTIPDRVTSIGDSAFHGCSKLNKITLPSETTSIGEGAFSGCGSLTELNIPGKVTSIGDGAFLGCSKIKSISIPYGVTSIGGYTFRDCTEMTSISIPDSVASIGEWAFDNCYSLKSIVIPANVTRIEDNTFAFCKALETVTIPDKVTNIGKWAFGWCYGLKSIVIPAGVTTIDDTALAGNIQNLQFIFFKGTKVQWEQIGFSGETRAVVHYNATDHTWNSATCEKPKTCKVCGATEGKALGHKYGPWKTVRTATCASAGARERICSVCRKKQTESIPVINHSWTEYVSQPASEFVTGVLTHSCTKCGTSYNTAIPQIVLPTDLPKVKISKPSAAKKKLTAKWKKPNGKNLKKIDGIEIRVTGPGYDNVFTAGKKKTSKKIGGLQSKQKYTVRVRAYKYINGEKHVSAWSGGKTAKIK